MKQLARLLLISAMLVLGACAQDSETETATTADPSTQEDYLGPGEIAIVDGVRIPESVYRVYTMGALQTNVENLTEEGKDEIRERLVYVQVLANEAKRRGLDQERRIAAEMELQRIQYLARAMANRFAEENPPTESELRELYENNLPRLRANQYQTRHILVDSEELAQDLLDQLEDGADFAELAREHSSDSADVGGDLGWITAESVVAPVGEAIQSATLGEPVSSPVESQFGWHVILVEDMREQAAPGLDEVRDQVREAVESQKLDEFAASLKEAAEVLVVD
jgi:peptidyl-prolyl cis-trans isomerase C